MFWERDIGTIARVDEGSGPSDVVVEPLSDCVGELYWVAFGEEMSGIGDDDAVMVWEGFCETWNGFVRRSEIVGTAEDQEDRQG